MAGDWIKMRLDLLEDPAVMEMAESLDVREEVIVGYCHAFWSWVSRQCDDGTVSGVSLSSVGRRLNLPGFPEMLVKVGWLEYDESGSKPEIRIPNFERHLSGGAKDRARATDRQRTSRTRHASVTTKTNIPATLRKNVLERDLRTCRYCGWSDGKNAPAGPYVGCKISVDHIQPESLGGATTLGNLVTCCTVCNKTKGTRTLQALNWQLPSVTPVSHITRDKSVTREEKRREEKSNNTNSLSGSVEPDRDPPEVTPSKAKPYSPQFEQFWQAFPPQRRTAKGKAWNAWKVAIGRVDYTEPGEYLIQRATDYAKSDKGRGEYAQMPSSWLTGRCWEDDDSTWKDNGSPPPPAPRKRTEEDERSLIEYQLRKQVQDRGWGWSEQKILEVIELELEKWKAEATP